MSVVVAPDVGRSTSPPQHKRQHLVEEGLPGGGVQAGGVGDDTVHVEDDRRERRVRRFGRQACAAVSITAWPM
ncbi:MAG TPA: hypothetical protein VF086_17485 [Propionibacteriaceae bacterium]